MNVVHVTHEAVQKIGGIGSVLEGLITAAPYDAAVERTVLLAPLFSRDGGADGRLGRDGEVLYSSMDGRANHPLAGAFRDIQAKYHVEIVYGRRLLKNPLTGAQERPEVVLIDIGRMDGGRINGFKRRLFEVHGIRSDLYETSWEFEQYVRLAEPGLDAVRALGLASEATPCVLIAHEFMGLPTAYAAKLQGVPHLHTAFYAHEVATVRKIVEEHPGHDTMFYNVLRKGEEQGLFIEDVLGNQHGYFKHALVDASWNTDVTLAVGDPVVRELRFLSRRMREANIRLHYNGIPSHPIGLEEALESKSRLQDYIETLLRFRPDFVFTHVTRMVPSKGLWRDLAVCEHLEPGLRRENKTAVLIVLSTEIGGPRPRKDILHMEQWWDWPVAHREGLPDLTGGEALFYAGVQAFNARSRNCKIVYINQFGFDREHCGDRMSERMEFWDIRKGSDLEFGQSVYEPFGIAQLEALSFGSICVMSNVCGCAGFVEKASDSGGCPNVIVADYTALRPPRDTIDAYINLTRAQRETNNEVVAEQVAGEILSRLPRTPKEKAAFLRRGYELASRMSWDVVARDYFIPAMNDIVRVGTPGTHVVIGT